MSAVLDDDEGFVPEPQDGEPITRGEYRRMNHVILRRVSRVEQLCFEDKLDEKGKMIQPSLESIIKMATRHIRTLCDYARMLRWAVAGATALGGFLVVLHQLGLWTVWPF